MRKSGGTKAHVSDKRPLFGAPPMVAWPLLFNPT
jgi:hypothetical protein